MLIESLKNFTTDYCLEIAGETEYSALDDLINQYGLQNKCKLVGVRNNTINFFAGADLMLFHLDQKEYQTHFLKRGQ